MIRTLRAGATGLLLALVLAVPATAATVTVRVEGTSGTVLRTQVSPSDAVTVNKGYQPCPGDTMAGALELATGGDWSGAPYSVGQSVDVIKGESHVFGSGAFWGIDVNNQFAPVGVCDPSYVPAQGDEILFYPACDGPDLPTCYTADPLDVTAPATVAPGTPFTVHVDAWTGTTKAASAGATVAGGGATATTGADGNAAVTLTQRGPVDLVATNGEHVRDEAPVCVTDGADGFCGTSKPGEPAPAAPAPPAADKSAPAAKVTGITEGQAFRRAKAPRTITATVPEDASGLHAVKLGLSRSYMGRCWVLSGKKERFRRATCGHHANFVVGTAAEVSYLLPGRLGPGRYVLDVIAIDGALNRDALARGRNRVVFTVK
jgi:hypothetical protein